MTNNVDTREKLLQMMVPILLAIMFKYWSLEICIKAGFVLIITFQMWDVLGFFDTSEK